MKQLQIPIRYELVTYGFAYYRNVQFTADSSIAKLPYKVVPNS